MTTERVQQLLERLSICSIDHTGLILREPSFKDAHIYCVLSGLPSQKYGTLLEAYLVSNAGFTKTKAADCLGDCSKDGKTYELKASLGGAKHNKFNYVQIRLSHEIDEYLLTAYHLTATNVQEQGELYIFQVPKHDMKTLILEYGGYAHGTKKDHGPLTFESLNDSENKKEYALRPAFGDKCWGALLPFRISEATLLASSSKGEPARPARSSSDAPCLG